MGFDIDVAKEVAKRLQKKLVLCDMPFDALIPALKLHKIDCIAAGLTPTVERLKMEDSTIDTMLNKMTPTELYTTLARSLTSEQLQELYGNYNPRVEEA